jgi:phospholipase C
LRHGKKLLAAGAGVMATAAAAIGISVSSASAPASPPQPNTPIKHLVVIFDENVSFDHYFGTYPNALNPPGEPSFTSQPGTPSVNGLSVSNGLITANPNQYQPQRLDPSQALTCDQNHGYSAEQAAFDGGLMDKFVQNTTGSGCTQATNPDSGSYGPAGIAMDYYDGNTVTGLWNLAQHFALNDNSYNTQFGPSTPGAINLVSGQTNGAVAHGGTSSNIANGTLIGDAEPYFDQCSNSSLPLNSDGTPGGVTASLSGPNVGDLMNAKGVTWGWFQGGFTPSSVSAGRAICASSHNNVGNATVTDYSEHHEPFEYYGSTANPDHVSPSSVAQVGISDPISTTLNKAVNHQYDLSWFNAALSQGNLPQVSFLKPAAYQDGHAGYSDPLDEQRFIADAINSIEQSQYWPSTAIVIAYDDSDGWYDHQMGPIIRPSQDAADSLNGPGKCGSSATPPAQNDRCGVGPRTPLLVISPWSKQNYVDSTFTEQSSITRFIEDNWNLGRVGGGSADAASGLLTNMLDFNPSDQRAPAVIMDDNTGEITRTIPSTADSSAPTTTSTSSATTPASTTTTTPGSTVTTTTPAGTVTSTTGSGAPPPKAPKPAKWQLTCHATLQKRAVLEVVCAAGPTTKTAVAIRARLYRHGTMIGNVASALRKQHAALRFHSSLAKGAYVVRLSIDSGGLVRAQTDHVTVR